MAKIEKIDPIIGRKKRRNYTPISISESFSSMAWKPTPPRHPEEKEAALKYFRRDEFQSSKSSKASKPKTPHKKKEWTVMVYSAADNNLQESQYHDVDEMERVGSSSKVNLLVQFDHGGDEGAKRYYLHRNKQPQVSSPALETLGDTNMADPQVLSDFIQWGIKNYPAQHYFLIVSDHGRAWKELLDDDGHKNSMTVPQFGMALKNSREQTGVKIDVLGMDACLTGSTEFAYEVKDGADFLVASEETENKEGWPYEKILSQIPGATPESLAGGIVEIAREHQSALPTMSATKLAQMPQVGAEIKKLANAIINTSDSYRDIKDCFMESKNYGMIYELRDIYEACQKMVEKKVIGDERLKKAAQGVMNALDRAIVNEQHQVSPNEDDDYSSAHGLNIQGPSWYMLSGKSYDKLAFSAATLWNQAMLKVAKKAV